MKSKDEIGLPINNGKIVQDSKSQMLQTKNGYEQLIYRPITVENGIVSNYYREV